MDLKYKNNLLYGFVLASLLPIVSYGIILMLFEIGTGIGLFDEVANPQGGKRLRTTTLLSLIPNMILLNYYRGRYTQQTLRGILMATFLLAMIWLGWFYEEILMEF